MATGAVIARRPARRHAWAVTSRSRDRCLRCNMKRVWVPFAGRGLRVMYQRADGSYPQADATLPARTVPPCTGQLYGRDHRRKPAAASVQSPAEVSACQPPPGSAA